MSYLLTITHVDEEAIVRVLQIGRQGVSGPPADYSEIEDAPAADASALQYLYGWDGGQLVRVDIAALREFFNTSTPDDYAAWVAAFA